jgi:hypothetical protein
MAKPKGFFKRPPGPLGGMWSWKHLDLVKTWKMISTKRVRGFYMDFPDAVPVGSDFPEIELETTDGRTVNTKEFLGDKHFVLFTGAIT